jgi:hypothetical protein
MTATDNPNEYRIDLVEEGGKREVTTILFKLDAANDLQIIAKGDRAQRSEIIPMNLKQAFKKVKHVREEVLEDADF